MRSPPTLKLRWAKVELGGGVTRLFLRDFAREPGLGALTTFENTNLRLAFFHFRPLAGKQAFAIVRK